MIVVGYFLFLMILGHVFSDRQTSVPSILRYRNRFVEDLINRRNEMTIDEKKKYTLQYLHNRLYVIRFFERKYMNSTLIEKFSGYDRLREDFLIFKYHSYATTYPWSDRFQKYRSELLPEEAQEDWNRYKNKHKKLFQGEKWPVFLYWILNYPEEWREMDGGDGRLNFLFGEFLDATRYGLTPNKFTNCIIQDWKMSSDVVRHNKSYDYTVVFKSLLQTAIPNNVASCCFLFLDVTLNKYPLSREEKFEYMDQWEFQRIQLFGENVVDNTYLKV